MAGIPAETSLAQINTGAALKNKVFPFYTVKSVLLRETKDK